MKPALSHRLSVLMQSPFLVGEERARVARMIDRAEDEGADHVKDLPIELRRIMARHKDMCVDAGLLPADQRSTAP